jgi:NTP pyrophosphatase (non-canonical NTP hydrolase)
MDLKDYQDKAWSFAIDTAKNPRYVSAGLIAEVGEFYDIEAKYVRDGGDVVELERKAKKELGDILWFVAAKASINGWNLQEIAEGNISKLQARRDFGTIQGSGDDR